MSKEIIQNSRILIVDDHSANVLLMERILEQAGYTQFTSLTDPRQVMDRFRIYQPDLVVLDLMMPKIDGFALMTQLRGWIPEDTYLPILVITADVTRAARQKALSLGAKDFLTKPVDTAEASARIYNLLETRWLHRRLQVQNNQLDEMVRLKTSDLQEAHRRLSILDDAKGQFLNLISHELRTPLNGLFGSADLLLEELATRPECAELCEMFTVSRSRIMTIVDDALLLTQIEADGETFAPKSTSWTSVLDQALRQTVGFAKSRGVAVESAPQDLGFVNAHEELLLKALQALLHTAVKFAAEGDKITLNGGRTPDVSTLTISTPSGELSQAVLAKFFDVFSVDESNTPGAHIGLGPSVASRILSLFGGAVTVSNCSPSGIRFTISCVPADLTSAARLASAS
jgi:two-component system, sensor histidine kinase and response regulator